jgi:class 3 adenylate cyclase
MSLGKKEAERFELLKALYGLSNGDPGRFFEYGRLLEVTGLTFNDLISATRFLIGEGLIDPTFSDKLIGLTHAGVVAWEDVLREQKAVTGESAVSPAGSGNIAGSRATAKLVSILFLDIHGWSKLDERGIIQYVSNALPRIGRFLEESGSGNVNTWGDAIVATFDSATTAAQTALEIQRYFEEGGLDLPPGIRCRISLNAGDVVVHYNALTKRDDIFGDAVHLAARLEPVTIPGYIFCSERFAESLTNLGPKAWPLSELVSLPKGYGDVRVCVVTRRNAIDPRPGLALVGQSK